MDERPPASGWRDVDAILDEVLALSPSNRARYLDARFAADDPVRIEVEELLAADAETSALLDGEESIPAHYVASVASAAPLLGTSVGPYSLESVLGHGGMGTVYLAHRADDAFDKKVAVKIAGGEVVASKSWRDFLRERRILARLEHPNIARLYDGGSTEDGRPYLVMEYVEGRAITSYASGRPLKERLRLFMSVCDAVQYAHQNLLVHCDIKPNNVLVDALGVPKLLDFGIARMVSPDRSRSLSLTPGPRFTPAYASPEQLAGKPLTTATDIFSLGILLCEILTGRHPFSIESASLGDVERAIRAAAARPPSTLVGEEQREQERRQLRGDLDTIVLKALRFEPHLRYATAAALARDIDFHLSDLPLAARPETRLYLLKKLVRRNPWGSAVAALSLVALLAFFSTIALQSRRIQRERDIARARTAEAEVERSKAERTLTILTELFEAALTQPESDDTIDAEDILRRGYQRVATGLADLPETQAEVWARVASIYFARGQYRQALAVRARAAETLTEAYGTSHPATIEALAALANVHRASGNFGQAESLARIALEATHGQVADLLTLLGTIYEDMGETREAIACHHESLARREVDAPDDPATALSRSRLARGLGDLGDFEGAERLHGAALAGVRQSGDRMAVITALADFATTRMNEGRLVEAQRMLEEAMALLEDSGALSRPVVTALASELGECLARRGRHERAERLYGRAMALMREQDRAMGPLYGFVLLKQGALASDVGRPEEALVSLREAQAVLEAVLGPRHPAIAEALVGIARIERAAGNPGGSVDAARRALAIRCSHLPDDHWLVREAEGELGAGLLLLGNEEGGAWLVEESYRALAATFPADDNRVYTARELALSPRDGGDTKSGSFPH